MGVDQIGITLSGVVAVWLTQDKRATWQRWACIFGMLAQPFWFFAAWKAEQWGIFAMCTLYTYAWARGLWTHWLSPYSPARESLGEVRARWLKPSKGVLPCRGAQGSTNGPLARSRIAFGPGVHDAANPQGADLGYDDAGRNGPRACLLGPALMR
jgi:hypothetical protein